MKISFFFLISIQKSFYFYSNFHIRNVRKFEDFKRINLGVKLLKWRLCEGNRETIIVEWLNIEEKTFFGNWEWIVIRKTFPGRQFKKIVRSWSSKENGFRRK